MNATMKTLTALAGFGLAAFQGGAASADTVTGITTYGAPGTKNFSISYRLDGALATTAAGKTFKTRTFVNGNQIREEVTYCADLLFPISPTAQSVNIFNTNGKLADGRNVGAAAWLIWKFAAGATTDQARAALQLAIWKAIYDDHADFSKGRFQVTSVDATVRNLASSYLSQALTSSGFRTEWARVYDFASGTQDQIALVPEPGTIAMAGTGLAILGGVGLIRKRRRDAEESSSGEKAEV